jgi:quercetin dioxygenase-like cupin family protein
MPADETIAVGDVSIRFRLESEDTGGSLTMFECHVPAGARVPLPHSHDAFEESLYGLQGTVTFTVDGVEHALGPGDALCIPRGAVHGFVNETDADTAFLAVATPGVFGPQYFRDIAEVLAAGGPPDPARMGEVLRRHGLTPRPAPGG